MLDQLIAAALDDLLHDLPAAPVSRVRLEHVLRRVAQQAATEARNAALLGLRSTQQAADELGITMRMVQAHALRHDIGWKVGPGQYVFRPEDMDALREHLGKRGRPRKSEAIDE